MAVQDAEFKRLIAELPVREKRERKAYLSYTIVAVVLGGAWLAYSFIQVANLRAESQKLRTEVNEQQVLLGKTNDELKAKQEELNSIASQLRIPLEELNNLKRFGFLGNMEGPAGPTFLEESKKAHIETQSIKSPNEQKARRRNLSIRYFVRGSDNERVKYALENLEKDYGFVPKADERQKEPNTYSNTIWIVHNNVTPEDVKLLAYYLIRCGIQIKYIGPPTSTPERVRTAHESIWVVAEPKVSDEQPLTVEQIKSITASTLRQGTKPGIR